MEKKIWNEEEFFKIAKQYNSIKDLRDNEFNVYAAIKRRKLLPKLYSEHKFENINQNHNVQSIEGIKEEAKQYFDRSDCRIKNNTLYTKIYQRGLLDEIYPILEVKEEIQYNKTFEECRERASLYITLKNFKKFDFRHYKSAEQNGWLKEITKHYIKTK